MHAIHAYIHTYTFNCPHIHAYTESLCQRLHFYLALCMSDLAMGKAQNKLVLRIVAEVCERGWAGFGMKSGMFCGIYCRCIEKTWVLG